MAVLAGKGSYGTMVTSCDEPKLTEAGVMALAPAASWMVPPAPAETVRVLSGSLNCRVTGAFTPTATEVLGGVTLITRGCVVPLAVPVVNVWEYVVAGERPVVSASPVVIW